MMQSIRKRPAPVPRWDARPSEPHEIGLGARIREKGSIAIVFAGIAASVVWAACIAGCLFALVRLVLT